MKHEWIALGVYRILLGIKAGALFAFLPLFIAHLEGGITLMNLSLVIPSTIAFLLLPILGYHSDRLGQRRIVMVAELASIILFLTLTKTTNPLFVLVIASVADASIKITHPLILAGLSSVEKKGRALGILKSLGTLSGIGGTALGTLAVSIGYPTLMAFLGAISLFAGITSFFLPESIAKKSKKLEWKLPEVISLPLIAAVLWIGSGSMVARLWNPFTLQFTTDVQVGLLATGIGVALVAANVSAGILLDKYKKLTSQVCALLDTVILALTPLSASFSHIAGLRFLRVMPYAVQGVLAHKMALDVTEDSFGFSLTTTSALILLTNSVFPLIGGVIGGVTGYSGVYWAAAITSLGALLILKYY